MIKIDESGRIQVVRKDTGSFTITPKYRDEDEEIYRLKDGEVIRFIVYVYPEKPLLTKENGSQAEDGSVEFYLTSEDTDLPETTYGYRAKLIGRNGEEIDRIDTFIGAEAGRFEVI